MQRSNMSHLPKTRHRSALRSKLGPALLMGALVMGALAGCGDNTSAFKSAAQAEL